MAVDINNYEAYLLDYFEGRLGDDELEELRAFVLLHPELGIDLSGLDLPYVEPTGECFPKSLLIKDEPTEEEGRVLSYLEGLLSGADRLQFENELRSDRRLSKLVAEFRATSLTADQARFETGLLYRDRPTAEEEQVLRYREGLMSGQERLHFEKRLSGNTFLAELDRQFGHCVVSPDPAVEFPRKENLLRKTRVVTMWSVTWRAAAAVMLIAMLVSLLWPGNENPAAKQANHVAGAGQRVQPVRPSAPETAESGEKHVAEANQRRARDNKAIPSVSEKRSQKRSTLPAPSTKATSHPEPAVENEKPAGQLVTAPAPAVEDERTQPLKDADETRQAESNIVYGLENLAFAEEPADTSARRGFLEKAARFAQQFGRLGINVLQASRDENSVSLTLSDLTVEKKYGGL